MNYLKHPTEAGVLMSIVQTLGMLLVLAAFLLVLYVLPQLSAALGVVALVVWVVAVFFFLIEPAGTRGSDA